MNRAETIFIGDSEMATLMRSHDWSQTPLGAVSEWPTSLTTAVSICLNSRFPMVIWWGEEFVLLYNDAWRDLLGAKHPRALGQPGAQVWSEIWDVIGAQLHSVLETGQATWSNDLLLPVLRHGYVEEAYFTYSHSPIFLDNGDVGGAFTAVNETTRHVIGERRLRTLRELAANTVKAKSVDDACQIASDTLAENPYDIPFALFYLVEQDGTQARLVQTVRVAPGLDASPTLVDLTQTDDCWKLAHVRRTGAVKMLCPLVAPFSDLSGGAWDESPRTAIVLPIAQVGQTDLLSGLLVLGISPRREFDSDYQGFFDLVTTNVATAIANAYAYEEERKQAEALAELDRAKTVFFNNVSHEFRTPLTLMLSPLEDALLSLDAWESGHSQAESEALAPQALSPIRLKEQLQLARRNGLRLLKLVNTLLDFSRIEADRIQAVYEPTDLAALTADLTSIFRAAIEQVGLRLIVDCPPLPAPIYIDREMWEKIVLNLLSNAFKFTFEGEIQVTLRWSDPQSTQSARPSPSATAILEVRDTGIGISADDLPHVFKRFYRVKAGQGRSHEGSGIGLSLVQELVRLHGGTITVESELNQGTCFTLSIPVGCAHLPSARVASPTENHTASLEENRIAFLNEHRTASFSRSSTVTGAILYLEELLRWLPDQPNAINPLTQEALTLTSNAARESTPHILLADDNADMRDYLKRLLSQRYSVQAVADGLAVFTAIRQRRPDLVLLDVMMPGLDGFDVLQQLRSNSSTQHLPVILLSARAGEDAKVNGYAAGANDYLIKPFSARELLVRVEANLRIAELQRTATDRERRVRLEAEASQQRAEAAYSHINQILACMTDAFVAFDRQWRYTYANPAALDVLQKPLHELIGKHVWDEVFPNEVGGRAYRELHRALEEQSPVSWEEFGEPIQRWLEVRAYPFAEGIAVYFQDITERKQTHFALQQREEHLRLASESANLGLWHWDFQENNLTWSHQCKALFGLAAEHELTYASFLDSLHPSDRDRVEALRPLLKSGQLKNFEIEYRTIWSDGTVRWLVSRGSVTCDENDVPRFSMGVTFDISDRMEAEVALHESEALARAHAEELEAIMELVPVGIWIAHDPDCHRVTVNRAAYELMRAEPGDPTTATPTDAIYPFKFKLQRNGQDILPEDLSLQKAGRTGEEITEEVELVFEDGMIRSIYGRAIPLRCENGSVRGAIGAYVDLTEKKRADAERDRLLQIIADERAQFEAILRQMPEGVLIADAASGKLILSNQRANEILGYTPEVNHALGSDEPSVPYDAYRLNGQPYHLEDSPLVRSLRRGEVVQNEEIELRYQDGRCIYVDVHSSPVYNAQGQIISAVTVFQDITQRKQTEQALRDAEERLRVALQNAPITVFNQDTDLTYTWIYNPLIYNLEEMLGKHDRDYLPPEDADALTAIKQRVLDNGIGAREEIKITRNGIDSYYDLTVEPLRDSNGDMVGVTCAAIDISQLKRTELSVRDSEARFRGVVESNMVGIIFWDAEGCLTGGNEMAVQMLGYSRDELESRQIYWRDITPPEFHDLDAAMQAQIMAEGVCSPFEKAYRCKDGTHVPILIGGALLPGWRDRGVAYFLDITERKQAEAEREQLLAREQAARETAEAANRIKDEFLAVVSHELRSPLNPILGWVKLLRGHQLDEEKIDRALEVIERNAQMQAQLINDLLDVSRILRGKLSLNITSVALTPIIRGAMETVRLAAESKSIELSFDISPNKGTCSFPLHVMGDANRLQQVVWNLLSNAVKFTPQGGKVNVSLTHIEGNLNDETDAMDVSHVQTSRRSTHLCYAQIVVSDTGRGISRDFLPYVFDYFRQADSATTRKFGGLGLGLAIVRYLVELHGGTVQVDSSGENQGATFTVNLPLSKIPSTETLDDPDENGSTDETQNQLEGLRILVVDDDDHNREFLDFLLELHGATVITAANAPEAIASLAQFKPDVLLSDIGMPDVDGYMLMQQIKDTLPDAGNVLPAIALNSYAGQLDHKRHGRRVSPSHCQANRTRNPHRGDRARSRKLQCIILGDRRTA